MPDLATIASKIASDVIALSLKSDALRPGHVYLIQSKCGAEVKIGKSIQPKERIQSIRTQSGRVGRSHVSPLFRDATAVESAMHAAFQHSRQAGEWFAVDYRVAVHVMDIVGAFLQVDESVKTEKQLINKRKMTGALDSIMDAWAVKERSQQAAEYYARVSGMPVSLRDPESMKRAEDFYARVERAKGGHSTYEAACIFQTTWKRLKAFLIECGDIEEKTGRPTEKHVTAGRFVYENGSLKVTGKGMQFLQRRIDRSLMGVDL